MDINISVNFISLINRKQFQGLLTQFPELFVSLDKTKPCRCLNGGKCINSSCICQRGYEGDSCEKSKYKIIECIT